MSRTCSICQHPDREALHQALGAGEALRTIAARWSVSKTALLRHREAHLPTAPGMPQSLQSTEGGPQESHTATWPPEVQETLDEHQKVAAFLVAYRAMSEEDLLRIRVELPYGYYHVAIRLMVWQRDLESQLREWGVTPYALAPHRGGPT